MSSCVDEEKNKKTAKLTIYRFTNKRRRKPIE